MKLTGHAVGVGSYFFTSFLKAFQRSTYCILVFTEFPLKKNFLRPILNQVKLSKISTMDSNSVTPRPKLSALLNISFED